jgi:hypothetical protein
MKDGRPWGLSFVVTMNEIVELISQAIACIKLKTANPMDFTHSSADEAIELAM